MQRLAVFVRLVRPLGARATSRWSKVEMGPADPILGLTVAFKNDKSPNKVNLGVGAYRDDAGQPYVLPSVREAEKRLATADHEYAPIGGVPGFNTAAAKLTFGEDSVPLKEGRVASVQALSGTGSLRVGFEFVKRFLGAQDVYIPSPTWPNHKNIVRDSGHSGFKEYRYFDKATKGLDFKGLTTDLASAPSGSLVLMHACAHNPTGVDPTQEQWKDLSQLVKEKKHFVFFDSAYQGFASGDPVRDAFAIRYFVQQGHDVMVAQSFAKNFGLYGDRAGALHIITSSPKETEILLSQLRVLIRPMYSNPPLPGARIVETILTDKALSAQWAKDVKGMADRIITMRQALVDGLKKAGSTKDWSHITKQIGMFCYTGLNGDQVKKIIDEYHVYMTADGRVSVAGLTSKNVQYVADAIHAVSK